MRGIKQGSRKRNSGRRAKAKVDGQMARNLDKLAEFEEFNEKIIPKLRRMVLENWEPAKIRKAFAPMVQAKMIQDALAGNVQLMKDTLDRHEGSAVQRSDNVTRYAKMDKQELAALALQKLTDAGIIDVTGKRITGETE